ncbi:hypothetical protein [Tardiphaga sp. 839_C3_N1_4]|uniref:hypothetical protein n=1 Tax=Tardiphaga sp. 839_C3_N1_4 TaxID=3240761 RepID=UPI003F23A3ED
MSKKAILFVGVALACAFMLGRIDATSVKELLLLLEKGSNLVKGPAHFNVPTILLLTFIAALLLARADLMNERRWQIVDACWIFGGIVTLVLIVFAFRLDSSIAALRDGYRFLNATRMEIGHASNDFHQKWCMQFSKERKPAIPPDKLKTVCESAEVSRGESFRFAFPVHFISFDRQLPKYSSVGGNHWSSSNKDEMLFGAEWFAIERKKTQFNAWVDDTQAEFPNAQIAAVLQIFRIYWAYLFAIVAAFRFARPMVQIFRIDRRKDLVVTDSANLIVPMPANESSREIAMDRQSA